MRSRKLTNLIALTISALCAAVGLFFLFFILFDVLRNGISSINWALFTQDPAPPFGDSAGGLRNAFVGQGILTLVAVIIGVPLGMLGGTFLAEYGRFSKVGRVVSVLSDIAVSMPSIVIGTFVYAILVKPLHTFNGWAGAAALAVIMLPVIIRTTEDMMRLVPWTLREAAFALGAPYHKVIIQIVYKAASRGIFTGILLAIARIAGETAPLLFTSFNNNFFSLDMTEPMPSLTVTIYQYAASPYDSWVQMAWAAAFVITFFILILNIAGRLWIKR
ncbi:MAG: phosphate ABC transporter permease PstA [Deferribacteraceae bacterium]|jgi:phosphate transport system permease protein|nr:phosphate ABC transporter permease PstA [Deferribacteraceae bacterium]